MKYLALGLLLMSAAVVADSEDAVPVKQKDGALLVPVLNKLDIEMSDTPLKEKIPPHILASNDRFLTINVENDFFGSGVDREYTNGLRFTYFNVGADQPFYVDWIDRLVPAFETNKTTSSYFSFGHNLYSPSDITKTEFDPRDRPYAAFAYGSAGVSTVTDRHMDNVELTLGWVGPAVKGKEIQTSFHKFKGSPIPQGWEYQIKDEPGVILSWERVWPEYVTAEWDNKLFTRIAPHVGVTVGNIYTYANIGATIDLTPTAARWQSQPVRVRPAIPGSGFFENSDGNHGWMVYAGWDTRLMARNIFLDGNTFTDSHSVDKNLLVHDLAFGLAYSYKNWRASYSANWRSKEFKSPLAHTQIFGALTLSYRF